jgi:hypothetical protein
VRGEARDESRLSKRVDPTVTRPIEQLGSRRASAHRAQMFGGETNEVSSIQQGPDESMDRYHLIEGTVPHVIAAALDSTNMDLQAAATKLMSDLGQRGHVTLADQVGAARMPSD